MENIAPALLDWFYANRRILPFREDPTPYHVWLSEIMLQQTRVSAALPYYERFLAALPDIPALAGCEEEKLHKLWEGLGYYSRARNLHRAAQKVVLEYDGILPGNSVALRKLPGIGDYTAGAIASLAFGEKIPAVDGNLLRVLARLYAVKEDVLSSTGKKKITELAEKAPTWAISLLVVVGFEIVLSSAMAAATALSMPRLRSIGFMPAATNFMPSSTIAWARTKVV